LLLIVLAYVVDDALCTGGEDGDKVAGTLVGVRVTGGFVGLDVGICGAEVGVTVVTTTGTNFAQKKDAPELLCNIMDAN
jgi:hypothetical protein